MQGNQIQIIDVGRGPQLEGNRLTVMDIFYYLHRGYDFDFIQRAMPSLTRDEFDAVVAYVTDHREELVEEDRLVEERIRQGITEQKARGLYPEIDETVPAEQRVAELRKKLHQRLAEQAGTNCVHASR